MLPSGAFEFLVGPAGVEPTTNGLKVRFSMYFPLLIGVV